MTCAGDMTTNPASTELDLAIVVAVEEEAAALRSAWHTCRSLSLSGAPDYCQAWEGTWSGLKVVLVRCGQGPERAWKAAKALLQSYSPRVMLSAGLAGGLVPEFSVGDVLTLKRFATPWPEHPEVQEPPAELLSCWRQNSDMLRSRGFPAYCGPAVFSLSPRTLSTVLDKGAWALSTGAQVVDQESQAVCAAACLSGRVPYWGAVRALSDTAGEDMPLDFNQYCDARGNPQKLRIALAVLRRPSLLPGLMKLGLSTGRALKNLRAYLENFIKVASWNLYK